MISKRYFRKGHARAFNNQDKELYEKQSSVLKKIARAQSISATELAGFAARTKAPASQRSSNGEFGNAVFASFTLLCLSNVDNIKKKFTVHFLNYKPLKL